MKHTLLMAVALLMAAPLAFAHEPPRPVTLCQPAAGEPYHDYIAPVTGSLVLVGDGNLEECRIAPERIQVLSDNGARCQQLKQVRDNETERDEVRLVASHLHTLLCTPHTVLTDRTADYDGEYDYGHGGVILAVNTGDGASWGSEVCYGMVGHHSNNIYANESLTLPNTGPAFTVTSDFSLNATEPGPKGPRADCGDGVIQDCDFTPPDPSTHPFPANVVVDQVNLLIWQTFNNPGETCDPNDCAERNAPVAPALTRSNPFGNTHLVTTCPPGIDGAYWVFIENDLEAPHFPTGGHVWTY